MARLNKRKTITDNKMAAETSPIRNKTRRIKDLTLDQIELILTGKAIKIGDKEYTPSLDFYQQLILKLAGNVVPRTQEVTGEDGAPLAISIAQTIADKNGIKDS